MARPPSRSHGVLDDIRHFVLTVPARPTLIPIASDADREIYRQRILQRLGVSVDRFAILNIHRIGIRAPARHVFEEFLGWDGDSTCWPNQLATIRRREGRLEHLRMDFLGNLLRGQGLRRITLFRLDAVRIRSVPDLLEPDSARYGLFESGGGYPMGVFAFYVRSSIAEQGEVEPTQLFMILGFNFFGREEWSHVRLVNRLWQSVHNRVTANVLNRFRQLCEWRFDRLRHPTERSNR